MANDYPKNMGAVSGIVGLAGGLGGFVLPILFGALVDLTGVRSSCFMLMYGVVWVSLTWMYFSEVRRRPLLGRQPRSPLPRLPALSKETNMSVLQKPDSGPVIHDWRRRTQRSGGQRQTDGDAQPVDFHSALLLAFAVWMVWSTVIVRLNAIGFSFTTDQLFWLAALPGCPGHLAGLLLLYGADLRRPSLDRPEHRVAAAALDLDGLRRAGPGTSYNVFVLIALLCGFGGGNFASSMSNISFFYPKSQQGTALGLNAGLGNLGVSVMQFCVPLVITFGAFGVMGGSPQALPDGGQLWLQNAGFIWVPFILAVTLAAWFGMNDLSSAKASFSEQAVIFKRKHNWLMCWLYLATFGSFIGFSAAFPLLIKTSFPDVIALRFAFLGPWSVPWSAVGWLAGGQAWRREGDLVELRGDDRDGLRCVAFLAHNGVGGNFYGFLGLFMLLFITTGIGNGSTFRMIPVIFRTLHEKFSAGRRRGSRAGAEECRQGIGRGAGLQFGGRRLRCVLHSEILRHFDGPDRRPGDGLLHVRRLLPELHRGDLVVVRAQRRRDTLLSRAESNHCVGGHRTPRSLRGVHRESFTGSTAVLQPQAKRVCRRSRGDPQGVP
ncbi:hypothetical protein QNM99_12805 [Pseudomonas sp. PCH446]